MRYGEGFCSSSEEARQRGKAGVKTCITRSAAQFLGTLWRRDPFGATKKGPGGRKVGYLPAYALSKNISS